MFAAVGVVVVAVWLIAGTEVLRRRAVRNGGSKPPMPWKMIAVVLMCVAIPLVLYAAR